MASNASSPPNARLVIPDLAGKVVLVTGASTGIGAAVARAFGAQGARVAIHYYSSEKEAQAVAKDIGGPGPNVLLVKGDSCDPEQCQAIVEKTAAHFGRIDGLINNAGLMLGRVNSLEATDEHFSSVLDLNARSVWATTKAAAPWLSKQGGFVINTSSIAARNGGAGGAMLYAAAKGFVSTLTHGHAKELIGKGVRVNGVAPGVITTPFHERYSTAEQLETIRLGIPAQRLGTAEDCVGAYLFLASEALSSYVVGQIIEVNGGQLMP
jgi:3-oxoacyl-[acyl-carrier protein] reductase